MTARRIIAVGIAAVALALPASASAWQFKFNYFQLSGVSGQAHKLVIRKCSGGKFGNYTLSSKQYILIQDSSSDLYVDLDMDVKLPVFTQEKKLQVQHFELTYSDDFPDQAANEIHDSLVHFFNMSHTKLVDGGAKLQFKQNGLELGGEDVIEPGVSTAPFKPKPGC